MYVEPEYKIKQKQCAERRDRLIQKATAAEMVFKKRLDDAGIYYKFQKGFISEGQFCIADFYLPKPKKIVIEIDGGYHQTKKQALRDKYKDRYYKQRNMNVIRILNEDVLKFDLEALK